MRVWVLRDLVSPCFSSIRRALELLALVHWIPKDAQMEMWGKQGAGVREADRYGERKGKRGKGDRSVCPCLAWALYAVAQSILV